MDARPAGRTAQSFTRGYGSPLRLLVAADVRIYRDSLVAALAKLPCFSVVSAAGLAESASRVRDFAPRVALVDVAMREGHDIIRHLTRQSDRLTVLALGVDEDTPAVVQCARAGAAGYLTPESSVDDLIEAIERVAHGEVVCSPRAATQLFREIVERRSAPRSRQDDAALTSRERDVLELICEGRSNKEIASTLSIAEATVKHHVHHLLTKLDVTTRAQAAALAFNQRHAGRRMPPPEPASLDTSMERWPQSA